VGLWHRSCRQARQMRHLLLWSASISIASFHCNLQCDMIGINGESSFESSLLKRAPGCEVWGYDYSVNSVRVSCHFFCQGPFLTILFDQWGPEITDVVTLRNRAHFQPWALSGTDDHGEHSSPKYWTLDSLMKLNGTSCFISPNLVLLRYSSWFHIRSHVY
jgi:hypothetical protein